MSDESRCLVRTARAPVEPYASWDSASWRKVSPLTMSHHMGEKPGPQAAGAGEAAVRHGGPPRRLPGQGPLRPPGRHGVPGRRLHRQLRRVLLHPGNRPRRTDISTSRQAAAGRCSSRTGRGWWKVSRRQEQVRLGCRSRTAPRPCSMPNLRRPSRGRSATAFPWQVLERVCPCQGQRGLVSWRANFYKCADASSHPHWLTWPPVGLASRISTGESSSARSSSDPDVLRGAGAHPRGG